MGSPSDYQYISNDVLEAADRQDRADQWAAKARADLATRWGDAARAPVSSPTNVQDLKDSQSWPAPAPPQTPAPAPFGQPADDGSAPAPAGDFGPGVSVRPIPNAPGGPPVRAASLATPVPNAVPDAPAAAPWAPSATSRQTTGWTPQTTAGISGGVPRTVSQTGGAFYGLDDQGVQTVGAAGDIARQAGYGDEGARALQSVLLTEGGLTGARGDYGKSAGPLQFLRDQGMLPAFAKYLGSNQDDAATYAEQNPLEAIQWAVGSSDRPGYLGAALKFGLQKGLTGADLATYVQANGQRSQSPERAGQWHNVLFGNGQDPFSTAASTQRQTVAGGQWGGGDTAPGPGSDTLAPRPMAGGAADRQDRIDAFNRPSQFGLGLSAGDALAACGPAAAIAFARAYGRNPTTDEAMQLAKAAGWDSQTGMKGIASEQALLTSLGVQTKMQTAVDWRQIGQEAANGNPVIISTPGHFYTIDSVQEDPQGQQYFHVGTSGTDLKGGAEWMTAVDMQRLMGNAQGALYANHPLAEGPSITESTKPLPYQTAKDAIGGAFSAIGQKASDIQQAVRNVAQDPSAAAGSAVNAVGAALPTFQGNAPQSSGVPSRIPIQAPPGPTEAPVTAPLVDRGVMDQGVLAPISARVTQRLAESGSLNPGDIGQDPINAIAEKGASAIVNASPGLQAADQQAGGATRSLVAQGLAIYLGLLQPQAEAGAAARGVASSAFGDEQRLIAQAVANGRAQELAQTLQQLTQRVNAAGGSPADLRSMVGDLKAQVDSILNRPSASPLAADAGDRGSVATGAQAVPTNTAPALTTPAPNGPATGAGAPRGPYYPESGRPVLSRGGPGVVPGTPRPGVPAAQGYTPEALEGIIADAEAKGIPESKIAPARKALEDLKASQLAGAESTASSGGATSPPPANVIDVTNQLDKRGGEVSPAARALRLSPAQQAAQDAAGANPYLLATAPGPGLAPLSDAEALSYHQDLEAQHEAIDGRIQELENRLYGGSLKAGKGTGQVKQTATQARAELKQLNVQLDQLQAAGDHMMENGNATFYKRDVSATPEALPWDNGASANAAAPAGQTADATQGAALANPPANAGAPSTGPEAAAGAGAVPGQATSAATAVSAQPFEQRLADLQASDAYKAARPRQQIAMVQDMAEGRPPAQTSPAPGTQVGPVTRQPLPQAGQDLHGPTELNAGLTPQAVGRSGARLFAPATQATPGIQAALDTLDGETRGAAARIDTMVGRGQLTQDVGNSLYQKTKFDGYRQFLNDVANAPDGVIQKGAGVTHPAGWKDGANFGTELSNSWLAPESATVVENIRDQVNGSTLADAINAVNRPFSLLKEATLGGSTYHLGQEAWQTVRLTRQNAPAVLARSLANAADPSGKLYQSFRTSSTWAPWAERLADAGMTMITKTPEGELVDLMRGPGALAIRTGAGAGAGFVKGYLGESDPQKRFEAGLRDAGLGAAFGAFGSYMVPALWERGVPTMKIMAGRILIEKGMSVAAAVSMVNNTFGGENLVRIARAPIVQAAMRAGVFAPDWWANWGRNVFRAINPADMSEVGKEAKAYMATTLVTGAVTVEALNRLFAGHSALENDRDHLADVDMTRVWGPDPKTGQRQYLNFLGPVADIINASANPGQFLTRRLGYIPNLITEGASGYTASGYQLPNVLSELKGGKTYAPYGQPPTPSLAERALAVAANTVEGAYPAGASNAQRMYERGGPGAAAASVLTGARESSEPFPTRASASRGGQSIRAPQPARAVKP